MTVVNLYSLQGILYLFHVKMNSYSYFQMFYLKHILLLSRIGKTVVFAWGQLVRRFRFTQISMHYSLTVKTIDCAQLPDRSTLMWVVQVYILALGDKAARLSRQTKCTPVLLPQNVNRFAFKVYIYFSVVCELCANREHSPPSHYGHRCCSQGKYSAKWCREPRCYQVTW